MRFSTIVSVVTLVWGISPRQPSGKNIIRWLLKKRTNGSVRYCQYTSSQKMTKTAVNEALRRLKKAGIDKPELEAFLREMIEGKQKSWLTHCTDAEALKIDSVIGEVLADHPGLLNVLSQRYVGRGMSKRRMAELLNEQYPEWALITCRRRVDQWLRVAEFILYSPMREAFDYA
ncbi:DUF1133 family protein [Shigella flexneri]|nr:DUF1133 family protein [Shigella flexneri]